jgi:ATP-dependent Lon protease
MTETLNLPVLPSADDVVLPGMVAPLALDGEAQAAVDAARSASDGRLVLVPRVNGAYSADGVVATIEQVGRLPSGEPAAVLRGLRRARIGAGVTGAGAALWVQVTVLDEAPVTDHTRELAASYKALAVSILQQRGAWQFVDGLQKMSDPSTLADTAGYAPYLDVEKKLWLLATASIDERLEKLIEWSRSHLAELEVSEKIRDDVREGMEKSQREFLLRQQMAAIRKELGEGEPDGSEDYRTRVEAADLPAKVREAALREVNKLERSSDQNPEVGWIRTWLDTVLELPWNVRTTDSTDVVTAREVLDADHEGLDDVKDRIVEYLAVRTRRAERGLEIVGGRGSGAVLALVGPPGVGKTSLGESVARALGRNFVRVALGGVRDEAEIRGHRRTYVGALPGRLVRAIREAGSMNPVVLLDEVDKIGADFRGDPASALLEVLDPAQNHTFRDHYLELELDLSDVLFLATANVADTIPTPLLDRMEVVPLDGYTEDEKVAIARNHLLPRQLQRAALESTDVLVDDDALRLIAREHTREAGVRQLERAVARVLRKVATTLAAAPTQHRRLARRPSARRTPWNPLGAYGTRSLAGRPQRRSAFTLFAAARRCTRVPIVAARGCSRSRERAPRGS